MSTARLVRLLRGRRGEGDSIGSAGPGWRAVIAGAVVLVAYLLSPDVFHNFIAWMIDSVFSALGQATGNEVESPVAPTQEPGVLDDPNRTPPADGGR